jgi:hypothetical protein
LKHGREAEGRIAPRIDDAVLIENFSEQLASGKVADATATDTNLPPLLKSVRADSYRPDFRLGFPIRM